MRRIHRFPYKRVQRMLEKGRNLCKDFEMIEYELAKIFDAFGLDTVSAQTEEIISDNLQDAISCCMQYEEYKIDEVMNEIKTALNEARRNNAP